MLDLWKKQFSRDRLSLKHDDPEIFFRSEWQTTNGPSIYYFLYRWIVTLFFFVSWLLSVIDINHLDEDAISRLKWMIFLTNWGYTMCVLQALMCTLILTFWFFTSGRKGQGVLDNKALKLYKIYWATNIIATDIAFGITVLYWTLIYEETKMQVDAMNVLVHGTNSVLMLLELCIAAHPVRWVHFYLTISFGLVYVIFSGIYYLCGGTSKNGKIAIYPILNWENPGTTTLVCLGVMVFLIALHIFSYGIFRLRKLVSSKLADKSPDHLAKSPAKNPHENPAFVEDAPTNHVV